MRPPQGQQAVQDEKEDLTGRNVLNLEQARGWRNVAAESPDARKIRMHLIAGIKNWEGPLRRKIKVRSVGNGGPGSVVDADGNTVGKNEYYTVPIGMRTLKTLIAGCLYFVEHEICNFDCRGAYF